MTLRGVRRLQLVSVILFGVSLLLAVLAVLFQSFLKPLFTGDPDVTGLTVVPWEPLISQVWSLLLAAVWLVFCHKLRSASAGKTVVLILLIESFIRLLTGPLLSLRYNTYISANGTTFIVTHNIVARLVSAASLLPLPAASVLMFLSMGGYYGKEPAGQNSGGMTLRGVRKLLTAAAILVGAAVLIILLIFALRGPFMRLFSAPEEVVAAAGSPSLILCLFLQLLPLLVLPVIALPVVLRKHSAAFSRKFTVLFSVLYVIAILLSRLLSFLFSILLARFNVNALAAYSTLSSAVSFFAAPLISAACTLMIYALGGYYGKE